MICSPSTPRPWSLLASSSTRLMLPPPPPSPHFRSSRRAFLVPSHTFHFLSARSITTPRRHLFVSAASKSPYEILGVPPSASDADIKSAYRKLALKWHPDVNKAPGAERKFMLIKNAYQTLIDPVSRSEYDSVNGNFNPFDWYSSTSGEDNQEDYYGIDDFWKDLQLSLDEIVNSLQEDLGMKEKSTNKPKSLWEELTEIGGEFVEFIERELNTLYDLNQPMDEQESTVGHDKSANDKERETRELEEDINQIEELLVRLRKELGL